MALASLHSKISVLNLLFVLLLTSCIFCQNSVFPVNTFHGFIKVGPASADIFYWGFPSKSNPVSDPVIFWFNGGPGVSSVLGLLQENGPILLDQDTGFLTVNSLGWNQNATIIYVDHPVGVGLSHANQRDIPQIEQQNAPLMLEFFTQLFEVRTDLNDRDIYLFGESYAGHFVPFIAQILRQSQQPIFRIKGVGLGNSLMSAQYQYPEYSEFAYALENRNYTKTTEAVFESTKKQFQACSGALKFSPGRVKDGLLRDFCQGVYLQLVLDDDGNEKFDVFNIRNPPQLKSKRKIRTLQEIDIEGYMNDPAVLLELQSDKLFVEETDGYFDVMTRRDWATNVLPVLGYLLDNEVKVLAYHGRLDFICNWMGGLAAIDSIPWSKRAEFNAALLEDYHGYGSMKQHGLLQFLIINNAGHMVPQDQPADSLDMLTRFIFGQN